MTATERAIAFVNRYPAMFTEDKEWWIATIGLEIIEAQKEVIAEVKSELLKGETK